MLYKYLLYIIFSQCDNYFMSTHGEAGTELRRGEYRDEQICEMMSSGKPLPPGNLYRKLY